jgi:Mn-dependent DtxR family transcriptional regulator
MKRKKLNSKHSKRYEAKLRPRIERARVKVVEFARRHGSVTSAQAQEILAVSQAYYHLAELARMGYLEHAGYNLWRYRSVGRRKSAELQL